MDVRAISTLTFDVVGTLIDFETGILEWFRPHLREHGAEIDDAVVLDRFAAAEDRLQREHPEMPFTAMLPRIYVDLARQWELDTDEQDSMDFRDSIRDWPAFPDSVSGLRTLGEHFRLVAVTNADKWALEAMSQALGNPFAAQVTCDEVGVNKPDPAVWAHVLDKLDTGPETILHCAQSQYHDIASARAAGLATAWIERRHGTEGWGATPPPDDTVTPDIHVHSLAELVEMLTTALQAE